MASSDNFNDIPGPLANTHLYRGAAREGSDDITHFEVDGIPFTIHQPVKDLVVEWNILHNALPPDLRSEAAVQELDKLCTKNRHLFDNTQVARQIREICDKWCASDRKDVDIVRQDLENLRQSIDHMLTGSLGKLYD